MAGQKKKRIGTPKGQVEIAVLRSVDSLRLRIIGLSWRQIGAQLNVSHETARKDVKNALKATIGSIQIEADEYRELELERLDQLWARYFPLALGGKQPDYKDAKGEIVIGETFAQEENSHNAGHICSSEPS